MKKLKNIKKIFHFPVIFEHCNKKQKNKNDVQNFKEEYNLFPAVFEHHNH